MITIITIIYHGYKDNSICIASQSPLITPILSSYSTSSDTYIYVTYDPLLLLMLAFFSQYHVLRTHSSVSMAQGVRVCG